MLRGILIEEIPLRPRFVTQGIKFEGCWLLLHPTPISKFVPFLQSKGPDSKIIVYTPDTTHRSHESQYTVLLNRITRDEG